MCIFYSQVFTTPLSTPTPIYGLDRYVLLLNNFCCHILHLYNIVIPIISSLTSVKLKKAGMASQNIVMKKQYMLL